MNITKPLDETDLETLARQAGGALRALLGIERQYWSFFQNEHGETYALLYDFDLDVGFMMGDETGWEPLRYTFDPASTCTDPRPGEPFLGFHFADFGFWRPEEARWLAECAKFIRFGITQARAQTQTH